MALPLAMSTFQEGSAENRSERKLLKGEVLDFVIPAYGAIFISLPIGLKPFGILAATKRLRHCSPGTMCKTDGHASLNEPGRNQLGSNVEKGFRESSRLLCTARQYKFHDRCRRFDRAEHYALDPHAAEQIGQY